MGRPTGFRDILEEVLESTVMQDHLDRLHGTDTHFGRIGSKINQFADDFNVFDLLPTEFR